MSDLPEEVVAKAKMLCREHYSKETCVEQNDKEEWLTAVAEDYWHAFVCSGCDGTGYGNACPQCRGAGLVDAVLCVGCDGSGFGNACPTCGGNGVSR